MFGFLTISLTGRIGLTAVYQFVDQGIQVKDFLFFLLFLTGILDKLVDDGVHVFDVTDNAVFYPVLIVWQHFGCQANTGQRRTQVVGNTRGHYHTVVLKLFNALVHAVKRAGYFDHLAAAFFRQRRWELSATNLHCGAL